MKERKVRIERLEQCGLLIRILQAILLRRMPTRKCSNGLKGRLA